VSRSLNAAEILGQTHFFELGQQPNHFGDPFPEDPPDIFSSDVAVLDNIVKQRGTNKRWRVEIELVYKRHCDSHGVKYVGRAFVASLTRVSFMGDLVGQVFALFVLTVAAGEAAIGLAIVVVYFRNRGSIAVEDINMMKG